jgi:GT2 family glycosyltransferase
MDSNKLNKKQMSLSFKKIEDYQKSLLLEKDIEIKALKRDVGLLESEKINIINSLSFKVGSILTYPFRFIFGLFQDTPKHNPIKFSCDNAVVCNNYLEVSGWALSDTKIVKVEVFANSIYLGEARLGFYRADVNSSFNEDLNSAYSGFVFNLKTTTHYKIVTVKAFDEEDNYVEVQKVIIPSFKSMNLTTQYQIYLEQQAPLTLETLEIDINGFHYKPLISIIVPTYNVEQQWLDLCIQSILDQAYPNWQLCLYDDASTSEQTIACLHSWQDKDERIKIKFGKDNQGISLASNEAIKMATGEFIALLDHDDELTPDALCEIVKCLNDNPDCDFIYSDEDKIEADGSLSDPHFKTDFNLETLLSWNYFCHFAVIRKSLGDEIEWFRKGFEGSQDYDLFLRVTSKTKNIHRIPKVLYHWRKIEGSTAVAIDNKDYALLASQKALEDYMHTNHLKGTIEAGLFPNSFRLRRALDESQMVSIIIPFRDGPELLKSCLESLLQKTSYPNYEILLIDNQSINSEVIDYCKELTDKHQRIKYHQFNEEFNYSRINNWAVHQAIGDYVLFLNNDIEVINTDWLEALLEPIQSHDVAAVGAKLLYEDDTIQHAGIVINENSAVHVNKGLEDGENGYFERSNYIQNVSACTAACLLVKKDVFLEVGGFDEELFKIAYNDVDLCLKMRQAGYLITYTPYAKLYHYESKSRGLDSDPEKLDRFTKEIKSYQNKWSETYKNGDPYFNPNLLPTSEKIMLNIK